MTPPWNPSTTSNSKKKVDFSPSLGSIDSEGPTVSSSPNQAHHGNNANATNQNHTWDTETDHILSYFLGGEGGGQQHASIPDFSSSEHHPPASELPHPGAPNNNNNTTEETNKNEEEEPAPPPPPTPALHFYSHSSSTAQQPQHKHHGMPDGVPVSSANSSSSSLSSMTAALVSGGPLVFPHLPRQQQQQSNKNATTGTGSPMNHDNESPISPAAMIGPENENLMLPPPPQQEQQQHLAWLRDINARAKAAQQQQQVATATSASMPPPHMPPPYPHQLLYGHQHPIHAPAPKPPHHHHHHRSQEKESEEKRAKRLERNRESARKSRRRKKERLVALEKQVQALHNQIEDCRTTQINQMVPHLMQHYRSQAILNNSQDHQAMDQLIRRTGPCNPTSYSILEFQYNVLIKMLLPRHQKWLLYLTLQDNETFFGAGKKEHEQQEQSGRVSSKQIGEDLLKSMTRKGTDKTARCTDAARFWPLCCYELSLSVEQEEKFVASHKRGEPALVQSRSQTAAAVSTAMNLRQAIQSLCRRVTEREETTLVSTLTAQQVGVLYEWLSQHRNRCQRTVEQRREQNPMPMGDLYDICRRLSQVLQISKTGET